MTDFPTDDARLDKTEAQMRRALGLTGDTSVRSTPHQSTIGGNGSHPQRRQFVRDGDVPVTIIHHQSGGESASQLDAARQAIRTQAAAREHAERLLEQAQATIRNLETKLCHERLGNDEAIERATTERRTVEQALETARTELSAEKTGRERADQALRHAQSTIADLTEQLHAAQQALATIKAELAIEHRKAQEACREPIAAATIKARANVDQPVETVRRPRGRPRKQPVVQTVEKPSGDAVLQPPRRRGRPPKPPAEKPVKWWLAA